MRLLLLTFFTLSQAFTGQLEQLFGTLQNAMQGGETEVAPGIGPINETIFRENVRLNRDPSVDFINITWAKVFRKQVQWGPITGEVNYQQILNDVIQNRQEDIAKIVSVFQENSESFFQDVISMVTEQYSGKPFTN